MRRAILCTFLVVLLSPISAGPAWAYIGPGAGITAIGTVIALLGGVALLVVGFVWYPVKRLCRKLKRASGDDGSGSGAGSLS